MADIVLAQNEQLPITTESRWRDMGDGTHALVVSATVAAGGAINADIRVGGAAVSNANPVPMSDAGGSLTVDQATHDNLNANANMQVGDADVANGNPVPMSDAGGSLTVDQSTHDNLNANANIQVGDADVANGNPVPVSDAGGSLTVDQATHDSFNANANVQVNDTDASTTNPVPITEGDVVSISVTPTISAASIYADGDALGGKLEFANAVLAAGGEGIIEKITVIDEDQELAGIDFVLFDQDFTATNDNAAFDPSDADLANCLGFVDIAATSDYSDFNDNSVAAKTSGLRMPFYFKLAAGQTALRGQAVVRGTPTYTATDDLTYIFTIRRL